jgi:hypothetical protein
VRREPGVRSIDRIFASWSLSITGKSTMIWLACDGVAVSRLRTGPMPIVMLVTIDSRKLSSGGFVTCANACVK